MTVIEIELCSGSREKVAVAVVVVGTLVDPFSGVLRMTVSGVGSATE